MLQLALFGQDVDFSLSPQIHHSFAKHFGLRLNYRIINTDPVRFTEDVARFRSEGGRGANVTVPLKVLALELATALTPEAVRVGAVNTLQFDGDQVLGDNTDVAGFCEDMLARGWQSGERAIVWGCGGASRAVVRALTQLGASWVGLACRQDNMSNKLAEEVKGVVAVPWNQKQAVRIDWVINATTVTPTEHWLPLSGARGYYDLRYGERARAALHLVKTQGIPSACDGVGMLVRQAAASFRLWTGFQPLPELVEKVLLQCSTL